jgi:O-antigen ligase
VSTIAAALDRAVPVASIRWALLAATGAGLVGVALAWNLTAGVGVAILIAVAVAVVLRPANILGVLVGAVYLELFKIGGVAVTRLVAPIALIVVLAAAVKKETAIRWSSPLGWAIAYAVWALASGLWTESMSGTTYALASLAIAFVYMLAFASLITSKAELNRVLFIVAMFSLALGVLSILAFTGRHPLGLTLAGEGRAGGGTGNPNFFAAIQVITLPLILVLAVYEQRTVRRGLLVVAAIINLGSILSTLSRGGTLSLLLVVILLVALPARSIFHTRGRKALAIGLILLAGTAFVVRYSADVAPRLLSIVGGSEQTDAGSGRLGIWPAAWNEFTEHPWTGIGFGAFVEVSVERILDTPISQDFELFATEPKEVHNAYLGTLTELGLPGLVLFMGLFISTVVSLLRTAKRAHAAAEPYVASVAMAIVVGLAGWAIGSVFAESETARPRWIMIGICLALPKLLPSPRPDPVPDWRTGWQPSSNGRAAAEVGRPAPP